MVTVEERNATAVATWVYLLHTAGVRAADGALEQACEAVGAATAAADGEAAASQLVAAVSGALSEASVEAVARTWFGDRVSGGMGEGARDARTTRMRRHQFNSGLPWLARVVERAPDGGVQANWLLVERVTDQVSVMDPNPWDDVDEERTVPLGDFQVLWELTGCSAIAVE